VNQYVWRWWLNDCVVLGLSLRQRHQQNCSKNTQTGFS
jgi:hypothetical protein